MGSQGGSGSPSTQNSHKPEGQGSNPSSIGQREAFGIYSLCLYCLSLTGLTGAAEGSHSGQGEPLGQCWTQIYAH